MPPSFVIAIIGLSAGLGGTAVGAGVAWGVLKERLRQADERHTAHEKSSGERSAALEARVGALENERVTTAERLVRMETKLDLLLTRPAPTA